MIHPLHSQPKDFAYPRVLARAHAELLTHKDLQFDFPQFIRPQAPAWLIALAKFVESIWPYLKYLIWLGFLSGIVLIVSLIAREIIRRGWTAKRNKEELLAVPPAWRPSPELAIVLLQDVDALAARGFFAEAVHLLLLRSIQHIEEQRPNLVKPALTSREIGVLDQLPVESRATFAGIAHVVERGLFAARAVGESEFARCRDAYEKFAFPSHWAGAERV